MENKIRSTLNEIYFGKTKDIVNGLRWDMTCWSDLLQQVQSVGSVWTLLILSLWPFITVTLLVAGFQTLCHLSSTLCSRSIESLPDNQKYRQLQKELSQVLTQRQIFID